MNMATNGPSFCVIAERGRANFRQHIDIQPTDFIRFEGLPVLCEATQHRDCPVNMKHLQTPLHAHICQARYTYKHTTTPTGYITQKQNAEKWQDLYWLRILKRKQQHSVLIEPSWAIIANHRRLRSTYLITIKVWQNLTLDAIEIGHQRWKERKEQPPNSPLRLGNNVYPRCITSREGNIVLY